jgi:hypothetical protein
VLVFACEQVVTLMVGNSYNPNILSIPVHGGKPIKVGLLRGLLKKAELTEETFLALYK